MKYLSAKIVIPIFILLLLALGVGLAYAINPSSFSVAADYVETQYDTYYPKAARAIGIDISEQYYFGAAPVKTSPRRVNPKNALILPEINRAAVVIYPTQDNKTRSYTGTPPVYVGLAIEIDLSTQRFLVWQDGKLRYNWPTSTGRSDKPTKRGNFKILSKHEMAYGSGEGDFWAMPYWMGFYWAGGVENGIHGLPFINGRKEGHGSLGYPVSHGCVRVSDANILALWNLAKIGDPVIVHR